MPCHSPHPQRLYELLEDSASAEYIEWAVPETRNEWGMAGRAADPLSEPICTIRIKDVDGFSSKVRRYLGAEVTITGSRKADHLEEDSGGGSSLHSGGRSYTMEITCRFFPAFSATRISHPSYASLMGMDLPNCPTSGVSVFSPGSSPWILLARSFILHCRTIGPRSLPSTMLQSSATNRSSRGAWIWCAGSAGERRRTRRVRDASLPRAWHACQPCSLPTADV